MLKTLPQRGTADPFVGLAWSAYDPLDRVIDSDDPLGFGAAVLYLADRLVPDLNVRTRQLRYYAMLCGGLALVGERLGRSSSVDRRRELFLVWEKLWALSQVRDGARGVIGVRGSAALLDQLNGRAAPLDGRFRFLAQQAYAGALGAYKTSCEGLGLLEPGELRPTDRGHELAAAFWASASQPRRLRDGVWRSIVMAKETSGPYPSLAGFRRAMTALRPNLPSDREIRLMRELLLDPVRATTLKMGRSGLKRKQLVDLHALHAISSKTPRDELEEARHQTAQQALALDGFVVKANFILERLVTAAAVRPVRPEHLPQRERDWTRMEKATRSAARTAAHGLTEGPLAEPGAWCRHVSVLKGGDLVRGLVDRHDEVMQSRRARRWLAVGGNSVVADRQPQDPAEPAPIRHAYRLEPFAQLARQAKVLL